MHVLYGGRGGRRGAWIDVDGGEGRNKMPTDNRNRNERDDRDAPKIEPWNLYRIVEVKKRNGDMTEEWVQCGVAWPMKKAEGFSFDVHFTIPEGARMAIMPRKTNGGGR